MGLLLDRAAIAAGWGTLSISEPKLVWFLLSFPVLLIVSENQEVGLRLAMAKKTGMTDSSLWILAVVLVALAAWMYFK